LENERKGMVEKRRKMDGVKKELSGKSSEG
jgi:hypothetical protein